MVKARRPGEGSKTVGAGGKIPAKELHHWWPKALSRLWSDENGMVSRLSYACELIQSPPRNFGAISNGHAIKLEGPWNGTIEPIFNFADSNLPSLVSDISAKLSQIANGQAKRMHPFYLSAEQRDILAEGLASLVIRSPAFRSRICLGTNSARGRFGMQDADGKNILIAANIHQWFPNAVADFKRAYFALLYTGKSEFIFGEGYLNNLSGPTFTSSLTALVPLTPQLAVLAFSGTGRAPKAPVCSIQLAASEVLAINDITQIYTKSYVYFRSQQPRITEAFAENRFLETSNRSAEILEKLQSEMRDADLRR